jgi:hypothetical protein
MVSTATGDGENPMSDGIHSRCLYCNTSYKEQQRLPETVNLCPKHLEAAYNGDKEVLRVIDDEGF